MQDVILFEIGRIIIPFIQMFGIYVIFNGHLSPGGGFAGGTIIGVSFILYRLIYKDIDIKSILNYSRIMKLMGGALLFYGALKGYSFLTGGAELHWYEIPLGVPGRILSGGLLLPLNIVVGIVVAFTMYVFYSLFDEGEI